MPDATSMRHIRMCTYKDVWDGYSILITFLIKLVMGLMSSRRTSIINTDSIYYVESKTAGLAQEQEGFGA